MTGTKKDYGVSMAPSYFKMPNLEEGTYEYEK
jgi:hypothetical protein